MILRNWHGWTAEWLRLVDSYRDAPREPGVYIICADRSINRAVGVDENGILTIGESEDLRRRLSSFVRCAREEDAIGHMAGWRFRTSGFEREFPLESLWVSWFPTEGKQAAYQKEGEMLAVYLEQHLELPPLNYKFNWSPQQDQ